jgi:uncharacterized protein
LRSIGIISDTHGLTRPEALAALQGSDLIIHAGDIGKPEVVEALRAVAPVRAIRGNVDRGEWADAFPRTDFVEVAGSYLYVLHDVNELDLDPAAADFRVVISGHSHQPSITSRDGVLYLNPGAAGPRRFHLPITVARLQIGAGAPAAEIIELSVSG